VRDTRDERLNDLPKARARAKGGRADLVRGGKTFPGAQGQELSSGGMNREGEGVRSRKIQKTGRVVNLREKAEVMEVQRKLGVTQGGRSAELGSGGKI